MTAKHLAVVAAAAFALLLAPRSATALDPQPEGDFAHTPALEQKANTPLPVYVEYPGPPLGRVILKYAGPGVKTWSRVEMRRVGNGWGALIPCGDVIAGTMRYWILGLDANGEPTATSADVKHPYVVPIRETIASRPPHLPGRPAPPSCERAEVPAEGAKGTTQETEPPARAPSGVASEAEAPATNEPAAEPAFARWWFGVAGTIDFLSLPAGDDLCVVDAEGLPANASGYYCTNPNGSDFPGRSSAGAAQNAALVAGQAGQVAGGLRPGDLRAMVTVDYAVRPDILLGVRFGYVMNSYPSDGAAVADHRAFGPSLHIEARGTYVFGDDPLTRTGFAPTAFAAAGASRFDGHAASVVSRGTPMGHGQVNQPVNVWLTNGPWFVAAGCGARYQFSLRAAFTALVRGNAAFGGAGALLTLGPEIGFQYGF